MKLDIKTKTKNFNKKIKEGFKNKTENLNIKLKERLTMEKPNFSKH